MSRAAMDTVEDALLGGRVRFLQPREGYRAGMDAVVLAAACDAKAGERVVDVGCGAGAVMLGAAAREPALRFVGVERDQAALDLAVRNIALNGFGERMDAVAGDVSQPWSRLGLEPFDAALANPPFFDDPTTLRGPAPAKTGAWLAEDGLDGWIAFLLKSVREGGTITLIHRADRLGDILRLLAAKAGSIQIRPVHPFADAPAKRVVVRAIKTGKAPLLILPGLALHDPNAAGLQAIDALARGERLSWARNSHPATLTET